MNHTIKNAINKYEIDKHDINNQLTALYLISFNDSEVRAALRNVAQVRQYLTSLKGMKSCEVQYATA